MNTRITTRKYHTVLRGLCALITACGLGLLAVPASACWDGYLIESERVQIGQWEDAETASWRLAEVWDTARWVVRLQALLGPERSVESMHGLCQVILCKAQDSCEVVMEGEAKPGARALFDTLANSFEVPPKKRAALARLAPSLWTVQVAAGSNREALEQLALQINDIAPQGAMGFYEAGGFPALNPVAHLVPGHNAQGKPIFRLVVGAFLQKASAQDVVDALGLKGVASRVRPMPEVGAGS